jgi:hypothetical protein
MCAPRRNTAKPPRHFGAGGSEEKIERPRPVMRAPRVEANEPADLLKVFSCRFYFDRRRQKEIAGDG